MKKVLTLTLVLLFVLAVGIAFGQADSTSTAPFGLPTGIESVLVLALSYVVGLLVQKSPVWNEVIPVVRYVVLLLAHILGAPPAHAAGTADVTLPGSPAGAAGIDLMLVTLFDNVVHKGVRLVGKVFHLKLPSWF